MKDPNQVCELDHLVPLELGGADTLDNIWPQCGPNGVGLHERYFKLKDMVENYLTAPMVKAGRMDLDKTRRSYSPQTGRSILRLHSVSVEGTAAGFDPVQSGTLRNNSTPAKF